MKAHFFWAEVGCAALLLIQTASRAEESKAVDPVPKADAPPEVVLPPARNDRPRSAIDIAEAERQPGRDRIETDRDSFTPAVPTVGQNRVVLEAAYSFIDERSVSATQSYPEMLLRYGLTRRIELRLGWNLEVGGAGNSTSGSGGFDLEPENTTGIERETTVQYGVKVYLLEQSGYIPESSVILMGRSPTSGPDTDTHFVGTWAFGWNVGSRWKVDGAIRYSTANEEEDRFNVWAPSVVAKFEIAERWNAHLEYFGLFSTGKAEDFDRHYISPGLHFLATDNLEIGVRVGWGLNDQSSRFFANAGFGLRF